LTLSTCPIAIVAAPVEQVWGLLADPHRYALWWDAKTRSIIPQGLVRPGQQIFAETVALGRRWDVHITVQAVTPDTGQLDLLTRLPFGITARNRITCTSLDSQHTRVSFG